MCDAQCMSLFVVDVGRCPSTTVDAALVFDRVSEAKYSPFPGSTPRKAYFAPTLTIDEHAFISCWIDCAIENMPTVELIISNHGIWTKRDQLC